ncbi:hypothetical protein AUJ65_06440 [Candidatus Micrarchaeota archaeon CG1_02_51_15]|nr:MAG: hypothetical protein AUJ65_06440 [Candidatus Micrarchaeota archaeon CG1_02_51_15]
MKKKEKTVKFSKTAKCSNCPQWLLVAALVVAIAGAWLLLGVVFGSGSAADSSGLTYLARGSASYQSGQAVPKMLYSSPQACQTVNEGRIISLAYGSCARVVQESGSFQVSLTSVNYTQGSDRPLISLLLTKSLWAVNLQLEADNSNGRVYYNPDNGVFVAVESANPATQTSPAAIRLRV